MGRATSIVSAALFGALLVFLYHIAFAGDAIDRARVAERGAGTPDLSEPVANQEEAVGAAQPPPESETGRG